MNRTLKMLNEQTLVITGASSGIALTRPPPNVSVDKDLRSQPRREQSWAPAKGHDRDRLPPTKAETD